MGEPICERWISEAVSGKTFAEVGGLWGTVNEQVTGAARAGASATTMIDIAPTGEGEDDLWQRFRERAASLGVPDTTCLNGSIDDPETARRAGSFDVVCCNGVLYHCPDPLHTVRQLRAITRETLLLGTVTMPETVSTSAGTVAVEPGAALLVPAIGDSQRAVFAEWLRELGDVHIQADGVTHAAQSGWALDDVRPLVVVLHPRPRLRPAPRLRLRGRGGRKLLGGAATLYLARATGSPPSPGRGRRSVAGP